MRDLFKLFDRRYSAVNDNDGCSQNTNNNNAEDDNTQYLNQIEFNHRHRKKSLQASRSIKQGFTIVDSFFSQRKGGKRVPKCAFLLLAAGLFSIGTAIALLLLQPYEAIFRWKLIFEEDGEIFSLWKTPPVDLYIKIYLWNITNSEEFLSGREKMKVEEVGPYVYREVLSHKNVTFNDNGTVSAMPMHPLVWDEERSMGNREDDMFVLPNIALLSIAQVASEKSYFLRLPINLVIKQTNSVPIVNVTAKEFMFGYESPLTTLGNQFLPDWIYFDKVGLIDRMYDFVGDFETFYTGESDPRMSDLYDTFMGSQHLKQWEDDHCNKISGASDGTKFKSFIKPDEELLFFRKSMCRPQRLVRVGNATVKSELEAYKYKFEDHAMDNGDVDVRNKCFCREGNCLPAGLLDISPCYYGFPIALSYPHFLDTDEHVGEHVLGMKPNRDLHETYFYIQPTSGLPLELSVKFQINMAMRDVSNMNHVEQFSNIVFPMLWFDITLEKLPDSLRNRFIVYLNILPVVAAVCQYGLFVVGVVMLLVAIMRVSIKLSRALQPSHTVSKHRKYSMIHPDMIHRLGDVEKVYELTEKSKKNSISRTDLLCDANSSEKKLMLDDEPAISDDDGSDNDSDSDSNCDTLLREDDPNSADKSKYDDWRMGATSSNINDIDNDHFTNILQITEEDTDVADNENAPMIQSKSNALTVPTIRTSASDNHISNERFSDGSFLTIPGQTTSVNTSERLSGSDVSISFFLDRENINDTFDESTFANVSSDLNDQRRRKSEANVTFSLKK